MDNICLPKSQLLIILIFVIILVIIYKNMTNQKNGAFNDKILNKLMKKINQIENDKITNNNDNNINNNNNDNNINNNEIKIKKVYYDDFQPPEQINRHVRSINIPTRGFPENYQLKGLLLRDNTETAYNLFGRQKFPGSSQYEYYIIANMDRNHVKIPLKINGDKEIEEGQTINVPGTNQNNGSFTVKLYDYDLPRYIPY
jgi:hypothetical protein